MYDLKEIRPAWAEINLDNLAHNIREVRRLSKQPAIVTAVIKADGYGHGAKRSRRPCWKMAPIGCL